MSKLRKIYKNISSTIIDDYFSLSQEKIHFNNTGEYFQLIEDIIHKYGLKKIKYQKKNKDFENYDSDSEEGLKEEQKAKIPDIDFKTAILNYLGIEFEHGNNWVQSLYHEVSEHEFPSEDELLDSYYLDEFLIRTMPKCLYKSKDKILIPYSKIFTYRLITDYNSKNPLIQNELHKQYIYKYIKILKNQIDNPMNPINYMITNFKKYFIVIAKEQRDLLIDMKVHKKNGFFEKCNSICDNIFEQINNFILQLAGCLSLLYYKISNYEIFFDELDEFISLLMTILFEPNNNSNNREEQFENYNNFNKNYNNVNNNDENDFYKVIMDLVKLSKFEEIEEFKSIIAKKISVYPQDLNVQDIFCLNEKSVNYYINSFKKDFPGKIGDIPYKETINKLKKINELKSPIDKLILTKKIREEVRKEIVDFWSQVNKEDLKKKSLKLDMEADDYINIFAYTLIKADLPEIISNIAFTEIFTTEKIRYNINDYNMSTLKVCILMIKDLDKKKNEINNVDDEENI